MHINYPLPEEATKIISELIQHEYDAMALKQYISTCCLFKGYPLAAGYYNDEAVKEYNHAYRLKEFLIDRGVEPEQPEIEEADIEFTDLKSGVEANFKNEIEVTKAYEEGARKMFSIDLMAYNLLMDYMNTQHGEINENRRLYLAFENLSEADQKQMEQSVFGVPTAEPSV